MAMNVFRTITAVETIYTEDRRGITAHRLTYDCGHASDMNPIFDHSKEVGRSRRCFKCETEQVQAAKLVKAGEATEEQAPALVRHQRSCIVCGNGMIVRWDVVPKNERLAFDTQGKNGQLVRVTIHAGCLLEASAGRRISDELDFTEEEK